MGTNIRLGLLLLAACVATTRPMSTKGRKLAESTGFQQEFANNGVDDIFADDDFDMGFSMDDFGGGDDGGDVFADDDDDGGDGDDFFSIDGDDDSPLSSAGCGANATSTAANGTGCDGQDAGPPRVRDVLLEQLLEQVWADLQSQLQQDERFDPFDIDSRLPEPIALEQEGAGYQAKVSMSGMKLHGLSRIALERAVVSRDENLTDVAFDVAFAFDSLVINGSYSLKGTFGWWDLDSQGTQIFSIAMTNATFSYKMLMKIVDGFDSSFGCGPAGSAQITEIRLPLEYEDVNFDFRNLGDFANTVVNGVGIYFLQTQEETMIRELKSKIKQKFNSLIC